MKKLFTFLWILLAVAIAHAEPPPMPMVWAKATEIYISTHQVRLYSPNAVYTQTHIEPTPCDGNCTEGAWYSVDLKPYGVTADAKGAFLAGMLGITHGTTIETANMLVTFRRPGDTAASCLKYLGQVIEAHVGGGQRSPLSNFVPLEDGKFEWCYTTGTPGNWPLHSAYLANMTLQVFFR